MSAFLSTLEPPLPLPPHSIPDGRPHLLLCATGSVATIKIPSIVTALSAYKIRIRVVLTPSASQFLSGASAEQPSLPALRELPNVEAVYLDEDEWKEPWTRGKGILHIELRRWADLCVIAPLSANSMAKMVSGLSDGLLLSTVRAWDTTGEVDPVRFGARDTATQDGTSDQDGHGAPESDGVERISGAEQAQREVQETTSRRNKKIIVVAPAMNTAMWKHPVTAQHMKVLEGDWNVTKGGWVEVLRPMEKELACGDTGVGAMRDWNEIVILIEQRLGLKS